MRRFVYLVILAAISISGCKKEYQPPPETIPDIKPGRGSPGADGGPASSGGSKVTGGASLAPPK
jgi:hypothetical protein